MTNCNAFEEPRFSHAIDFEGVFVADALGLVQAYRFRSKHQCLIPRYTPLWDVVFVGEAEDGGDFAEGGRKVGWEVTRG